MFFIVLNNYFSLNKKKKALAVSVKISFWLLQQPCLCVSINIPNAHPTFNRTVRQVSYRIDSVLDLGLMDMTFG